MAIPHRVWTPVRLGVFFCLAVLAAVAYWHGLDGPLILDDHEKLAPFMVDQNLERHGWRTYILSDSGPLGRPVAMVTFLANAWLSGDHVFPYKLVNLVLHLVSGLLIGLLVLHLAAPVYEDDRRALLLAAMVAGIWLLHPLHVSTVLYTVQRMTQLAALFMLAGLVSYVVGRERQIIMSQGGLLTAAAFLLFLPLATLSKENGVLLLPLLYLTECIFFRFAGPARHANILKTVYTVCLLLPVLALVVYVFLFPQLLTDMYEFREFTPVERLLTQPRVLMLYLYLILAPNLRAMGMFHDDFPLSHGLLTPPETAVAILLLVTLLVIALLLYRRNRLFSYGVLFYFVAHLLESTIIPLEMVFEHRNYLPSIGILLAAGALLLQFLRRRTLLVTLMVPYLGLLFMLSATRAQIWATEQDLYKFIYESHPDSRRAKAVYAHLLTTQGHYTEALATLAPYRSNGARINKLYLDCVQTGSIPRSDFLALRDSLDTPITTYAANGLGSITELVLLGRCRIDIPTYIAVLDTAFARLIDTQTITKHTFLIHKGYLLLLLGETDNAIRFMNQAYKFWDEDPWPLLEATRWLLALERPEAAREQFNRALAALPQSRFSYVDEIATIEKELNDLQTRNAQREEQNDD